MHLSSLSRVHTAGLASLALLLSACSGGPSRAGNGGDLLFSTHFGSSENDVVTGLAVTADGRAFVAGELDGSTMNAGSEQFSKGAFLAAFDEGGGISWARSVRNGELPVLSGVAANGVGHPVVAGMLQADEDRLFVDALDADGEARWNHSFSSTKQAYTAGVAVDAEGNVLLAGTFVGAIDMGAEKVSSAIATTLFVTKFDAAGKALWTKDLAEIDLGNAGFDIVADATGNVFLAGGFEGKAVFADGKLESAGSSDAFVLKLDPQGDVLWHRRFGDAAYQSVNCIAAGSNGTVVLAGHGGGSFELGAAPSGDPNAFEAFMAALDADGNVLFSKMFGDSGADHAEGVAVAADGSILLTGGARDAIDFGGGPLAGDGAFVAKFDAGGSPIWSRHFEGGSTVGVGVDAAGRATVAGWFQESLDLGDGPIAGAPSWEVFVARFGP